MYNDTHSRESNSNNQTHRLVPTVTCEEDRGETELHRLSVVPWLGLTHYEFSIPFVIIIISDFSKKSSLFSENSEKNILDELRLIFSISQKATRERNKIVSQFGNLNKDISNSG